MTIYMLDSVSPWTLVRMDKIEPFVKWAGGKRQLIDRIERRLPSMQNYYEPFLGGGALFYYLRQHNLVKGVSYLSDKLSDLIAAYNAVKDQPERLMDLLSSAMFVNSEENFYEVRQWGLQGLDPLTMGARMIFLNKTGYNGLYRVNSEGKFNVAYRHTPGSTVFDRENILAASWALQGAVVRNVDFERLLIEYPPYTQDFVFFDPPHWKRFVAYTGVRFDWSDQVRLLNTCSKLDRYGVKWMVSNSDVPDIWELWNGFKIEKVSVNRMINTDANGRTGHTELLIRNY